MEEEEDGANEYPMEPLVRKQQNRGKGGKRKGKGGRISEAELQRALEGKADWC